jgi:anti-anti-sigma factor
MTNSMCEPMPTLMIAATEPADRAELARGPLLRDQVTGLLDRLAPLVVQRNVTLDLTCVNRIDAAGISTLLALYRSARESGHRFAVTNASARVAQILSVVGLDRILLSHNAVRHSQYGSGMRRPAA